MNVSEKVHHFTTAMYGYYTAHPYRRGGSAIGRPFFAGLYLAMFGKKIPQLPDGFDVEAMVATQDVFVAKYTKVLDLARTQ